MAGIDVRCDRCEGDPSALRLTVTETTWYLLDLTDEGVFPHQSERDGELKFRLVCLDCGHEGDLGADACAKVRARLVHE